MIIQQERNEPGTAPSGQLVVAVVSRPVVLENPSTFETLTISNQIEVRDLSVLLNRMLQELPEVQKEVISLASNGISRREIAARSKISLGRGKIQHLA